MPRKRTKNAKIELVNRKLVEANYDSIDNVVSKLNDALTELQSIGLPQEVFDETENKILDAITETENLRDGIF